MLEFAGITELRPVSVQLPYPHAAVTAVIQQFGDRSHFSGRDALYIHHCHR